jgi:hypothetical protein
MHACMQRCPHLRNSACNEFVVICVAFFTFTAQPLPRWQQVQGCKMCLAI